VFTIEIFFLIDFNENRSSPFSKSFLCYLFNSRSFIFHCIDQIIFWYFTFACTFSFFLCSYFFPFICHILWIFLLFSQWIFSLFSQCSRLIATTLYKESQHKKLSFYVPFEFHLLCEYIDPTWDLAVISAWIIINACYLAVRTFSNWACIV